MGPRPRAHADGLSRDQYARLPSEPGIARLPNRIMSVASADVPLKGLIYLIRAYALLLPQFPDLELLVVSKLREGTPRSS